MKRILLHVAVLSPLAAVIYGGIKLSDMSSMRAPAQSELVTTEVGNGAALRGYTDSEIAFGVQAAAFQRAKERDEAMNKTEAPSEPQPAMVPTWDELYRASYLEAFEKYPSLRNGDSEHFQAVAAYKERLSETGSILLNDPNWPLVLADTVASMMASDLAVESTRVHTKRPSVSMQGYRAASGQPNPNANDPFGDLQRSLEHQSEMNRANLNFQIQRQMATESFRELNRR